MFSVCLNREAPENEGVNTSHLEVNSLDSLIESLHKAQKDDASVMYILEKLNTAFDLGIPKSVENPNDTCGSPALSGVECMEIFCRDYNNIFAVIETLKGNEQIICVAVDVLSRLIISRYAKLMQQLGWLPAVLVNGKIEILLSDFCNLFL